jgi:succinate dehydrogenase/fumarate reductase-like Fe-S protein
MVDEAQMMLDRYQSPNRNISTSHHQQQQQPSQSSQYRKLNTANFCRTCNFCGHLLSACPQNQMKPIVGAVVPMQQRIALINVFTERLKLNCSQRRERNRKQYMLQSSSQVHGNSPQSSQLLQSFNATLRDRLPPKEHPITGRTLM